MPTANNKFIFRYRSAHHDREIEEWLLQLQEAVYRRYDEDFYQLSHLQRTRHRVLQMCQYCGAILPQQNKRTKEGLI